MAAHLETLATQELRLLVETGRRLPSIEFVLARDLIKEPRPLEWDIRGIFLKKSIVTLIGAPGAYKSFGAIDMAASIATGLDWHGRPTRQGAVCYLAGEGNAGLARRLKAWDIVRGSLDDAPLYVSKGGIGLIDPLNASAVGDEVDRLSKVHATTPVLVVVDTLARNFGVGDENSTADMSRFIENLDRHIREPFGCSVMIAHHTGHTASDRGRGSSALRAAVDTEIVFERNGELVTLSCAKSKDAQEFASLAFSPRVVPMPWNDDDGNPETSFVLQPSEIPAKTAGDPLGKNESRMIATLERLYDDARERLIAGGRDAKQALIRIDVWRKECELPKNRFYDGKESLDRRGRIVIEHPHVLLANNGVSYVGV